MGPFERFFPQVVVITGLAILAALSLGAASGEPTFDVTLRARDMAFYLDGEARPNPVLELPAGRLVRLTFVNEDNGVDHDLSLPDLGVQTRVLPGDGSSQVLELRVPASAVTGTYSCSLHLRMMTAGFEVR